MRYLGCKDNLLPFLDSTLEALGVRDGTFLDAFTGTATVAAHAKRRGFRVFANDLMSFSEVLAGAALEVNRWPGFHALPAACDASAPVSGTPSLDPQARPLERALGHLNALPAAQGFFYRNYSPEGSAQLALPRRYFTGENAGRIDAVRQAIEDWWTAGCLALEEYWLLLAALLEAIAGVSNISGTYAAFLKHWDPRAFKPLVLEPPPVIESDLAHRVFHGDANQLVAEVPCDVLYLDPPYNSRQYAPNYHILETAAVWDSPPLSGVTGLRPYAHQRSRYCRSDDAAAALAELVARARCRWVLLSYNSEGLIPESAIYAIFATRGSAQVFRQPYRRFRSDRDRENRQYQDPGNLTENLYVLEVENPCPK